jgi:hypothetical protein
MQRHKLVRIDVNMEIKEHLVRFDPELAKRLDTDLQMATEEMVETTEKLEGDS